MAVYKKLYWCYSLESDKRYFMIANSAREARRLFAFENRYYQKDVSIERLCRLPTQHQNTIQKHPDDVILTDCSVEFITDLVIKNKVTTSIKLMLKPGGRIFFYKKSFFQEDI